MVITERRMFMIVFLPLLIILYFWIGLAVSYAVDNNINALIVIFYPLLLVILIFVAIFWSASTIGEWIYEKFNRGFW